jgi:GNAT superfamily N-acetyltransferase
MASETKSTSAAIELMASPEDIVAGYDVVSACFGDQTQDGMWMAFNPGWDTPEGKKAGAQRMVTRWNSITRDHNGDPHTVFLKATVPSSEDQPNDPRKVVGFAIWVQLSVVDGYGDKPVEDLSTVMDLNELYPGDKAEHDYLIKLNRSFHAQRTKVVKNKASSSPPAVFALDMCVVDPAYQGRGIAKELVKWGIAEAERRGNLELVTEGSIMGRRVYEKLGFKPQWPEIVYEFDPQFESRSRPSNLFMRTGGD